MGVREGEILGQVGTRLDYKEWQSIDERSKKKIDCVKNKNYRHCRYSFV